MRTLRAKFIFWVCALFILIWIVIFIPLSIILPEKICSQILKRDIKIAQYLSREIQEPVLTNNRLILEMILKDRFNNFADAIYIFVLDSEGKVISATFKKGFPKGLLEVDRLAKQKTLFGMKDSDKNSYSVREFLKNGKKVYDISIPLLKGELGNLHMGVSLESGKAEIAEFTGINYYVAIIILIGLGIGILIFTSLGILLSNRIIRLKDFAAKIGQGDFDEKIDVKDNDELGTLAKSFNEMAVRLKENIAEIKRLTYFEERDRIALGFHDGLAQNLADIIKRLELCERLFKMRPQEAFEELKAMKENTRDVLRRTRLMILDLKSPEDLVFNLLPSLNTFIRDYQKQSNISVKLETVGSLDGISSDKAKAVFYIIQEALINVRKHSLADAVELRLKSTADKGLIVNIKDNGKGFNLREEELVLSNPCCGKWGMMGMRQRADSLGGTLFINTMPGQGTEVLVNIPLGGDRRHG